MSQETWDAVDAYIEQTVMGADPALEQALASSAAAGLPTIAVTPAQGKLLHLLTRIHGARRVLEIGTLGGYSTIWFARALPADGSVLSLELEASYAEVARGNLELAGVAELVEIRVGPAIESLERLVAQDTEPFDLVFIDADKQSTPEYFQHALSLTRRGAVIVTDNVVRAGALADAATEDPRALGMRRFHADLARAREQGLISATTIQTVGAKGYDGFTLAIVE